MNVQPGAEELEWKTRRSRVDPKLRSLGWKIIAFKSDLDVAELVSTEADLARREGRSFEPASELLIRASSHPGGGLNPISAEREAPPTSATAAGKSVRV